MRPIDAVSFVRNIIHYHAFFVVFIFIFFFSFLYMSFRLFLYFSLICSFFRAVWFENLCDKRIYKRIGVRKGILLGGGGGGEILP